MVTIRFRKWRDDIDGPDGLPAKSAHFEIEHGATKTRFDLLRPTEAELAFARAFGPTEEAIRLQSEIAMIRYGIRYIEQGVRLGSLDLGSLSISHVLDDAGATEAAALFRSSKSCGYQDRKGRELFCRADREDSSPAVSRSVCIACEIPDSRELCEALTHPSIHSAATFLHPAGALYEGMCDDGRGEVRTVGGCKIGGHPCAYRQIERATSDARSDLRPEILPHMIDFLERRLAARIREGSSFASTAHGDRGRDPVGSVHDAR